MAGQRAAKDPRKKPDADIADRLKKLEDKFAKVERLTLELDLPPEALLDSEQAAAMLSIRKGTFEDYARAGLIRSVWVGKYKRYPIALVKAFRTARIAEATKAPGTDPRGLPPKAVPKKR